MKNKNSLLGVVVAGVTIFIIYKIYRRSKDQTGSPIFPANFPKVEAFENPDFIKSEDRVNSSLMMTFNPSWWVVLKSIDENPKDDITIKGYFNQCRTQSQCGFLASKYKINYNKDLYTHLKSNLSRQEVIDIANKINSLPPYFKKVTK